MSFHEQPRQHALLRQKIRHMVNLKEDPTTWWARLPQAGHWFVGLVPEIVNKSFFSNFVLALFGDLTYLV